MTNDRPSHVRYRVLAIACVLALLTYINRLGFGVAAPEIKQEIGLSDEQMGYLASAFLVAYGLCQVPGGLVGDRIGGRNLLTILVLSWSLLSGATALGVLLPGGAALAFAVLLGLRFLFGVFQAAEFPTLARVLADWMPVGERASAQGLVWTFSRLGGALVPFLFAGMLWFFGTWTTPFWIMAGLGVLWCVVFWPWFRNRPEEMAQVNEAERACIAADRPAAPSRRAAVPWAALLRSRNVYCLCLMYGLVGFAGNFFTNLLPLYLRDHRALSKTETAWLSALPLAFGIGSCWLGGLLSDWMVRRFGSRKWGRRLNGAIGLLLAAAATLAIPWVADVWLLAVAVSAAFFFNDLNMGPAWAAAADIGERSAGTVSGMMNMVGGGFAAALGTAFAGFLFRRDLDTWVFVGFACSYVLAAGCWLLVDVSKPLGDNVETPTVPASEAIVFGAVTAAGVHR
jgi:MFS transporter, ACS family, glucarate transporter